MTNPIGQIAGYDAALEQVRAQIQEYLAGWWEQFGAAVIAGDIELAQATEMIATTVTAGQLSAANLTSAYLAEATGTQPSLVSPRQVQDRMAGVQKATVYARPFNQVLYEMRRGATESKAMKIGLRRLQSTAATDIQMSVVRQSKSSLSAAKVRHYRRITTGRENCALCLIASTQRYTVDDLLPIHGGCDCIVGPIPPGMDLDLVIDPQKLEDTHQQVKALAGVADRGGRSPDYRELIVTREHGEVGPNIAWRGQKFTGPDDLKTSPDPSGG